MGRLLVIAAVLLLLSCSHHGGQAATLEAVNGTIHDIMSVIGGEVWLPCTSYYYPHTNVRNVYNSDVPFNSNPVSQNSVDSQEMETSFSPSDDSNAVTERDFFSEVRAEAATSQLMRHRGQHMLVSNDATRQRFIHRSRKPLPYMRPRTDDKPILVLWYKDGLGTPIYSFDSRTSAGKTWADVDVLGDRASYNVTAATLKIHDLLPSDEGLYRCRVDYRNAATSITRTNLSVIVPPSPPTILDGVSGTAEPESYSFGPYNEGEPFTLTCAARGGRPRPRLLWYVSTTLLDDSYEQPEPGVISNSLHVQAADRSLLAGKLRCVAFVPQTPPQEKTIKLILNLRPSLVRILGARAPVTAGKVYLLECEASGSYPPAKITWFLDGRELTSHITASRDGGNVSVSTLRYMPAEDDDGSRLECRAASPSLPHKPLDDFWKLTVNYLPSTSIRLGPALSPDNIRAGDDVFLECSVRAKPWIYRLSWRHNGAEVIHNVSGGIITSNQSLVLQHLSRTQAGLYTCVGSNTEGDGESSPLKLQVRYAPVCADNLPHIYDAARNEEVTVRCGLDAFPANVSFRWRFNNSGEMVDISPDHIRTKDLESSLSYIARTDLDYGTLLCWGSNSLGLQKHPCMYRVIPAEQPKPPINCTVVNDDIVLDREYDETDSRISKRTQDATEEMTEKLHDAFQADDRAMVVEGNEVRSGVLVIKCHSENNMELPIMFTALVYDASTQKLLSNVTNSTIPEFYIKGFERISDLDIAIYSMNNRGISSQVTLKTRTSVDIAEKRTAQVRHSPSKPPVIDTNVDEAVDPSSRTQGEALLVPVLAVVLGILGSCGLIAVVAVLLLLVKRGSRTTQIDNRTCSLPESPESNPDVIPSYSEGEATSRASRSSGSELECSPLCSSPIRSRTKYQPQGNLVDIAYMDPIHPGADFVFPVVHGELPPNSFVCTAGHIASTRTNSAIVPPPRTSLAILPAHLCTSTSISSAHPIPPCQTRHQHPLSSAPIMHTNQNICTVAAQCHQYSPCRSYGQGLCGVCSLCQVDPVRIPENTKIIMNTAQASVGHIPPPIMFLKSDEVHLPLLQPSTSIHQTVRTPGEPHSSSYIPEQSTFDIHHNCKTVPNSAPCILCRQIPIQNNETEFSTHSSPSDGRGQLMSTSVRAQQCNLQQNKIEAQRSPQQRGSALSLAGKYRKEIVSSPARGTSGEYSGTTSIEGSKVQELSAANKNKCKQDTEETLLDHESLTESSV